CFSRVSTIDIPVPLQAYTFRHCHNDPDTTDFYTLSLHDALRSGFHHPGKAFGDINLGIAKQVAGWHPAIDKADGCSIGGFNPELDRKSTRLNSSHVKISYAVFCLKK